MKMIIRLSQCNDSFSTYLLTEAKYNYVVYDWVIEYPGYTARFLDKGIYKEIVRINHSYLNKSIVNPICILNKLYDTIFGFRYGVQFIYYL